MDAFANVLDMRARWLLRFSKNKSATKHFHAMQHPPILSIEPGEHWVGLMSIKRLPQLCRDRLK